jgi:hypothetical protein
MADVLASRNRIPSLPRKFLSERVDPPGSYAYDPRVTFLPEMKQLGFKGRDRLRILLELGCQSRRRWVIDMHPDTLRCVLNFSSEAHLNRFLLRLVDMNLFHLTEEGYPIPARRIIRFASHYPFDLVPQEIEGEEAWFNGGEEEWEAAFQANIGRR